MQSNFGAVIQTDAEATVILLSIFGPFSSISGWAQLNAIHSSEREDNELGKAANVETASLFVSLLSNVE